MNYIRTNIIPKMSSNSQNGFKASFIGERGNPTEPYNAFDRNDKTYFRSCIMPRCPEQLLLSFPKPFYINGFKIINGEYGMGSWDVDFEKENGSYITTNTYNNGQRTVSDMFKPIKCKGLRIFCKTPYYDNSWGVTEVELYEAVDLYIIKCEKCIYSLNEEGFLKVGSSDINLNLFYTYGFDENALLNIKESMWNNLKTENKKIELLMLPVDKDFKYNITAKINTIKPIYKIGGNETIKIYRKEL